MLIIVGEISIYQRPRLGARPKLIGVAKEMDFIGETSLSDEKRYRGATLMASGTQVVQALVLSRRGTYSKRRSEQM
jgi:hypothetical protein